MALISAEGFDGLSAVTELEGISTHGGSSWAPGWAIQTGRDGVGKALTLGGYDWIDIPIPATTELWVAFALSKIAGGDTGTWDVMQFGNASGILASITCELATGSALTARTGGHGGASLGNTVSTYSTTAFKAVGAKILFHASAGTVQLRCGGAAALELDLTGVNTAGVAVGAGCTFIRLSSDWSSWNGRGAYDDLVWGNASGSFNVACPPDLRVGWTPPTADTVDADFTPQGAGDNYVEVDEVPADGDTTYNESTTAGHTDRFGHSYAAANVSIIGVVVSAIVKAGGNMRLVLTGSAGTEEDNGADLTTDVTSYRIKSGTWETNPDTGALWVESALEDADMTFGYKVA